MSAWRLRGFSSFVKRWRWIWILSRINLNELNFLWWMKNLKKTLKVKLDTNLIYKRNPWIFAYFIVKIFIYYELSSPGNERLLLLPLWPIGHPCGLIVWNFLKPYIGIHYLCRRLNISCIYIIQLYKYPEYTLIHRSLNGGQFSVVTLI